MNATPFATKTSALGNPTKQFKAFELVLHCSTYCVIILQRDAEFTELVINAKSCAARKSFG